MQFSAIFSIQNIILYLFLIIFIWLFLSRKNYSGIERRYFIWAFLFRAFSTPLYILYHEYIQKTGDTFQYYVDSTFLADMFYSTPSRYFKLLFNNIEPYQFPDINENLHFILFQKDSAIVCKIGSLTGIMLNNSFLNMSLLFSVFAFAGCWKLFLIYKKLYPHLIKPLGLAILFIPSVVFWGTSLTKDSLCIGGLGFLVYSLFQLFIFREKKVINLIIIVLCFILFINVKLYILLAVLPALLFSFILKFIQGVQNKFLRISIGPIMILSFFLLVFWGLDLLGSIFINYSFQQIPEMLIRNYKYLAIEGGASSTYDLGTIQPTLQSILPKFPSAVNVTLFRPYIWEIKNPAMAIAALESVITLFITIFVFFRVGIFKCIKLIFKYPGLLFSVIYCIIFAFAIGISSGNFGTLIRYKIPLVPFYFSALVILYSYRRKKEINLVQ